MFEGDDQLKVHEVEGESLRYLAVEPAGYDPETSYPLIILLHGYGAKMGDLADLCPAIGANGYVYAFPNAPIPLEIGLDGYAWLVPPDLNGDQMAPATAEKLMSFVDEVVERYNVKPAKAILGGFSQGGMMSYYLGLPKPDVFSGVAAMSARIPDRDHLRSRLPESRTQPVFISHGTADQILDVSAAHLTRRFLEEEGFEPEYHEYDMAHEISQDVIGDLAAWVRKVLPPAS